MLRKLTEFAESTGASKAYRDTYLRTPKSGYTGIPVISRTPSESEIKMFESYLLTPFFKH